VKERALRRAERERLRAEGAATRARRAAHVQRRRKLVARLAGPARSLRVRPARGVLARRRRRAVALTVVVILGLQLLAWLLGHSWALSFGVLVFSLLLAPIVVALATDRR